MQNPEKSSGSKSTIEVKKVDRLAPTQVRLTVAYPAETVRRQEQSTAQKYASQARIPGFRPGKAPMKLVFERFGADIRRDILSALLQKGVWEAVEETKLYPVNQPEISWDGEILGNGQPLEFKVEYEVQPEIKVTTYKGIPLDAADEAVADKDIEQTFDQLRDRFSTMEPSTLQKTEPGSFAVVDVGYQLIEDPSIQEAPQPITVEMGTKNLLPNLEEAIETLSIGESADVESEFPKEYSNPKLAGKKAKFTLKLTEIKKKVMPELNDEFASNLKEGNTLEALRKEVVESLVESKKVQHRKEQKKQVVDFLLEKNPFPVPASMIAKQTERLTESITEDFKRQGQAVPKFSEDELAHLRVSAERTVRSSLVLSEIAKAETIQVDDSRVTQRIQGIADQWGRPVAEIEKMLEGRGMLDEIRREVLTDQVFDFLLENAKFEKAKH